VVEAAAADLGSYAVEVHNVADPQRQVLAADWALVSRRVEVLKQFGPPVVETRVFREWTDDYSNLFQVLK
jgi:hypothetical protein